MSYIQKYISHITHELSVSRSEKSILNHSISYNVSITHIKYLPTIILYKRK
jgi:hypothetical protein